MFAFKLIATNLIAIIVGIAVLTQWAQHLADKVDAMSLVISVAITSNIAIIGTIMSYRNR